MVSVIGIDNFSIECLSFDELKVLGNIIDSAPLPDKRFLYELRNDIKKVTSV